MPNNIESNAEDNWIFKAGDRALVNDKSTQMYRGKGVTVSARHETQPLVYWCKLDDGIPNFPQMFNQWELEPYIDGEVVEPAPKLAKEP